MNQSKNFENMKTLDEILEQSSIKNITKFIKKENYINMKKMDIFRVIILAIKKDIR